MDRLEEKAKRILLFSAVAVLFGALFVLFLKYLFLPVLPFFLAWLIAWPTMNLADIIHKKTRLPTRLLCFLFLLVFCCALFAALWFTLSHLFGEMMKLLSQENAIVDRLSGFYEDAVSFLSQHFPKLAPRLSESGFETRLIDFVSSKAGRISSLIVRAASHIPGVLFFAVVTFIAAYYLSCDNRAIKDRIASFIGEKRADKLRVVFRALKNSLGRYLRAGGYLLILTFVEVLFGLLILGVSFPFLLSAIIAALDFLPVLGTGVILAPTGLFFIAGGEYFKGFGCLILWGITTLVREIVEPKIVSKSVGIHPLLALFSAYTGLKLFGAPGLIFLPIFVTVASGVFKELRSRA